MSLNLQRKEINSPVGSILQNVSLHCKSGMRQSMSLSLTKRFSYKIFPTKLLYFMLYFFLNLFKLYDAMTEHA